MLVYGQIWRENDREERTFLKWWNYATDSFSLIKVNHSEMYMSVLSSLLIITILKPLPGNYFPADLGVQLKVH